MKRLFLFLLLLATVSRAADTDKKTIRSFIFAGQSNMVGTHSRVADINKFPTYAGLDKPQNKFLFSYKLGREEMETSDGWIDMQPTGDYFGPELSFAKTLQGKVSGNIAIAKFTHPGSQMNDWTPEGTTARDCNLYQPFIEFIRSSIQELKDKDHPVELAVIIYHAGENDMAFGAHRNQAAKWLQSTVAQSRIDLALPALKWHVSQQAPPDEEGLNSIDITANLATIAAADPAFHHLKAFDLSPHQEKLVFNTEGIVKLGELLARSYLEHTAEKRGNS